MIFNKVVILLRDISLNYKLNIKKQLMINLNIFIHF